MGQAELAPGQARRDYWHKQQEVYYFIEDQGVMEIDGAAHHVAVGLTVYVPGGAVRTLRNDSNQVIRILYVFAADVLG